MRHARRSLLASALVVLAARAGGATDPAPPSAAVPAPAAPPPPRDRSAMTGKERLGDKASDEQRVDDCKVPEERRTRARAALCRWDVGS